MDRAVGLGTALPAAGRACRGPALRSPGRFGRGRRWAGDFAAPYWVPPLSHADSPCRSPWPSLAASPGKDTDAVPLPGGKEMRPKGRIDGACAAERVAPTSTPTSVARYTSDWMAGP